MRDDLLKVGRDPDCDIRLNDLAVALHHATIEQISATQIGVSAEAGLTVEIDGAATQFGQIDLATGGTVKVGPFLLRILAAEMGSDDVAIDVARADTDAEEDRFDTRRFALATVMPGKRAVAWTLGIVVLGLFLAWPIYSFYSQRGTPPDQVASGYHADQLWLSGSLSPGHASLAQNCTACHAAPFQPVQDASCQACHTAVHDHADLARLQRARPDLGMWDRFQLAVADTFGQTPGRCVDCHTEHEGSQRMVPTPQQFCADCHTDLRARLPDTRLGDASDFEDAHPEFQPAVLVRWTGEQPQLQRVSLARNPREASNLRFPHALHLDPRGGVAQMGRRLGGEHGFGQQLECADCHVPTPDGVRFQPVDMERDCGMCHSLAFEQIGGVTRTLRHGEPRQVVADILSFARGNRGPAADLGAARSRPGDVNQIRAAIQFARARSQAAPRAAAAVRQAFSAEGTCGECHMVEAPASGFDYRIRPVAFPTRYMLHGWFDHRPHQAAQRPGRPRLEGSAACLSCHAADRSSDAGDLMLPNVASCRDCHGGETTRLPVESGCAMCHDYHMDEGVPAMLLRQQIRGRRWTSTVIRAQPAPAQR
ncbi:MAG: cytochrome c3 family protein [Sphingosinicella sp.]|uniref:cytochrome c3 family protein n=1 Tax=Sphingosinicella sp. TaxID=1917971 RepID=UPI004037F8D6